MECFGDPGTPVRAGSEETPRGVHDVLEEQWGSLMERLATVSAAEHLTRPLPKDASGHSAMIVHRLQSHRTHTVPTDIPWINEHEWGSEMR
jgi:hypothetical protein